MILEVIPARVLALRRIPNAAPALIRAYGGDPEKHSALGLISCDQDDSGYVALDEATKHANVEVIFARSFYAGADHASGPFSGEFLGILASSDPEEIEEGLKAALRCLEHDASFYSANEAGDLAVFPHVIASLGHYLSAEAGLAPGDSMAYLVAPPIEATFALDAALKAADVRAVKIFPPPTETNFAAAWLSGSQSACEAAAVAWLEAVIDLGRNPMGGAFR